MSAQNSAGTYAVLIAGMLIAVQASAAPNSESASAQAAPEIGTNIVGERDTAVGLYLVPWREEQASDMDRPPRLYDVPLQMLDADAFSARVQTQEGIAAYRRARSDRRR